MAKILGSAGIVKVGPGPTAVTGEVVSFALEETAEIREAVGLSDAWVTRAADTKSWSATIVAHFDAAGALDPLVAVGASVAVELYPAGDTLGLRYAAGAGLVETRSLAVERGDFQQLTLAITGNGALTWATVV